MILETKQSMVAYRCPHCGAGVMSIVGLFGLRAEMIKLKCTCKQSEMTLSYTQDSKIRFDVPCILCPSPHKFVVSSSVFFNRDLFVLPCPYTDVNICMMGEENNVKAELARSELELLDILEQHGMSDFGVFRNEEQKKLSDPQVKDIVLYVIKDLDAEGKIYCNCNADSEGEYEADITHDGIFVTCSRCHASKTIPTDSFLKAHAFLNTESITLE